MRYCHFERCLKTFGGGGGGCLDVGVTTVGNFKGNTPVQKRKQEMYRGFF